MAMQELRKIDVVSLAVVMGLVSAVIGLIIGVFFALGMGSIFGAMGILGAGEGLFFGVAAIVLIPIMTFIYGFVMSAIFALIYNFVASKYKGVLIELK